MTLAPYGINYPLPWRVGLRVLWPASRPDPGVFRAEAQAGVARLRPPLQVLGREHIPAGGPCLLTINHYHAPRFWAWWLVFAVSATMPVPVHWITSAALTFRDWPRRTFAAPVVRWFLARLAALYGFTTMPPMPPKPADVEARAQSVRRVLRYVHSAERPVVGLAPEGGDAPGGVLARPAPGLGRFVRHLAHAGLPIVPLGAYESAEGLCVRYGPAYRLEALPPGTPVDVADRLTSEIVMRRIASLLPCHLRGEFG
jgi:1-acyl-sn-glycerol-3-phosphate acyltransferase